jgi:hypothetical protein
MLADLAGKYALISLETSAHFIFDLFPVQIQSTDRANWEAQDVTRGTKPLFYSSSEPRRISVPDLMIDGSRTGETINDQIDALRELKNELPNTGAPPALLSVYGERQQRCVLEEVVVTEIFPFTAGGDPMRARVNLQLVELQEEGTAVSVTVNDEVGPPF